MYMPIILLINDDGIQSIGLIALKFGFGGKILIDAFVFS